MASSSTQIANIALAKIGQERIDSLSDDVTAARWANELYGTARDYVTEMHLWRHAKTVASLAETTNTRSDDYSYAYTRPSACLSFRYILPAQGAFDPKNLIRYEIDGAVIFTDEYQARGVYVAQTTDVTLFPPSFTDAVAWYLAHLLVQPLRQENNLLRVTADGFEQAVKRAIALGAIEEASWIKTADEAMADWHRYR